MQLSFNLFVNQEGDYVTTRDHIVLTKEFLRIALKYRNDEELSEVLSIDILDLKNLKKEFGIDMKPEQRITKERLKIMDVIQKYLNKYENIPSIQYIRRRTQYSYEFIHSQLKILSSQGYIEYKKASGVKNVLKAV